MESVSIFVAAHKPYEFSDDPAYRPILVGATTSQAKVDFAGDDSGHSISERNASYCELTGLYWAWKNAPSQITGLVHYRRYFAGTGWRGTATGAEITQWLSVADVVLARPRWYIIETVRSHYAHAHHERDLDIARAAITHLCPQYQGDFDAIMRQRHLSLYNMMIAKREYFDDYCAWLFPILDECYAAIPVDSYGPQQRRVIGYLGERLLNVWVHHHEDRLRVTRRKVVSLEPESLVKKGVGMIKRRRGKGRAD